MCSMRSAGYIGSSGTNAPPALITPSTAATRSSDLLHVHADEATRTDAETPEPMGDPVRALVELSEGESAALEHDGFRIRRPPRPVFEEILDERVLRERGRRLRPVRENHLALLVEKHRKPRDGTCRIGGDRLDELLEVATKPDGRRRRRTARCCTPRSC